MSNIKDLPISEFTFRYAEAIEEYNRAYQTKKTFEEEMQRRYREKLNICVDSQGRHTLEEMYLKENLEQLKQLKYFDLDTGEIIEREE